MKRGLGYLPDPPDPRDRHYSLSKTLRQMPGEDWVGPLPAEVSLRQYLPKGAEYDQGPLGSCVANALGYCFIMLDEAAGRQHRPLSRLFAYWHSRNQHGDSSRDTGTHIRTCVRAVNKLGRPPERVWTYDVTKFDIKPPPNVLMAAHDHRKASYQRIEVSGLARRAEIKFSIASERPVVFGTLVSHDFVEYRQRTDQMRLWNEPLPSEVAGGHAMAIVGYDEDGVEVVQSWGKGWGAEGFGRLSWNYLCSHVTTDVWSIGLR